MKKLTLLLVLFVITLFSLEGKVQEKLDDLADVEKAYVLAKFNAEVKYNFVFYNDLAFDWDSLCQVTLPILLETKTRDEFTNKLKQLAAKLNDGHTTIVPGNPKSKEDRIRPLPMTTKRIGNQVFVNEVFRNEFKKQGVSIGSEILEVNGMNVIDYVNRHMRPYTASSTSQWLEYAPYREFELTKGKGSEIIKLLLKNKDGKTHTLESHRNIDWDDNRGGNLNFQILEGNVGLLKISGFMDNTFTKDFDEIYEDISKTDGLIIDLRDNGGGNSNFADYIVRHLSVTPIKRGRWSSRMYIATHGSWGFSQEWYMETPHDLKSISGKEKYTKPTVLLTNAGTFSSAENFCILFRGMNRGKLIGTTTGGSTGNPIMVDLGYDIKAMICTRNEWDVEGNKFIGVGIKPDIEVEETNEMFLSERDVVIERALLELK